MNAPVRIALLAALPLALLGAAAAAKPFSHKLHVEEQEIGCKSCHDTTKPEGLPTLKTKGCGKCHEDGPPPYQGPTARKLGVKFPHAAHAAKMECAECHRDVLADAHADTAPLTEPKRCFACHEEKKVPLAGTSCARCHGEDKKRDKPADHDGAWRERHGDASRWRVFGDHGKACNDCHKPATCTSCHMTQEPRSHNGLWRVRTHGLSAGWDRDRCMTCHESGTCIRCHQDTKPVNHTAGWQSRHGLVAGARSNETCNTCHQPGWCAACHAGR
ncbi:MAG TPA: cytochrome c3 family protein [Myxococcales bacterium]|jgi:c(7)-type cytochrome triheme protein